MELIVAMIAVRVVSAEFRSLLIYLFFLLDRRFGSQFRHFFFYASYMDNILTGSP